MFRFFRSIRQQLLLRRQGFEGHVAENKTVKYAKYAVGEIVLIVIGIFLALQLNNWNEERLDRIEERYLLIELMDNLDQEAERLEYGIPILEMQLDRLEAVRDFLEGSSDDLHAVEEGLGMMHGVFAFNPVTSAYETMKGSSEGFSNRDLKARLFQYYDVDQALLMSSINRHRNKAHSQVEPLLQKHLKFISDELPFRGVPKNVNDPEFREDVEGLLVYLPRNVKRVLEHCTRVLESNREIRSIAEQELSN